MTTSGPIIDFFMSVESIWTFVGHNAFVRMCARQGARPCYRPVPLQALFAQTGGVAYRRRHLARQRYRDFELQRWSAQRNIRVDLASSFLPPAASLADRTILACTQMELDPAAFAQLVLNAAWVRREDVSDRRLVSALAQRAGLPAELVLRQAEEATTQALYAGAVQVAVAANVFGAPSFVFEGEVFWGQDRIEMLEQAIACGRTAYRPYQ